VAAPNLKLFYVGLIAVAIVGAGAIVFARGSGRSQVRTAVPLAPGDTAAPAGYVMGNANAPVEVEEYADFECPACQQFAVLTLPDVRDRLINTGQVRWRFRDFPLYQTHLKSPIAHEGAACAGEQGKFWEMHDQLYYNQSKWVEARNTEKAVREYAKAVGVDLAKYDECAESHRYQARIAASAKVGESRGVNSTPTLIVGGMMIPGGLTYDSLKAIVTKAASAKPRS
jgi:protein-disulfide isomerase